MTTKNKRAIGVAEIKVLLFTGSIVAVLGFWNIFARQDADKNLSTIQGDIFQSAQPPPGLALDLPPIPTLLPPSGIDQGQDGSDNGAFPQELRSVEAPAQQVSQSSNPVIVGGGNGNNSRGSTVTTTNSSR